MRRKPPVGWAIAVLSIASFAVLFSGEVPAPALFESPLPKIVSTWYMPSFFKDDVPPRGSKGVVIASQYAIWQEGQYMPDCQKLDDLQIETMHDYLPERVPRCPGIETVGRYWDDSLHDRPFRGTSKLVLTWNEPMLAGQAGLDRYEMLRDMGVPIANIDPLSERAVDGWLEIEAKHPAEEGWELGAPSSIIYLDGGTWWDNHRAIFKARTGRYPRYDYVVIDTYPQFSYEWAWIMLKADVRRAEAKCRQYAGCKGVIVAEWAFPPCCPDLDEETCRKHAERFTREAWRWLDEHVVAHFFFIAKANPAADHGFGFGSCVPTLFDWETEALTGLGKAFR